MVKDELGRTFGSLRISLTDLCNLACAYCTSDAKSTAKHEVAGGDRTKRYLEQVKALHDICQFKEVRLTGGEPLLYKGIDLLIADLLAMGIPKVKLTTNGTLLAKKAKALKASGLESLNVSLDVLNKQLFETMSRRHNFEQVLKGIEVAADVGLSPKINTVVMNGVNDQEIVPLFHYFKKRNIRIRYLEFMQMGELQGEYDRYFYPQANILEQIRGVASFKQLPRPVGATANYWETDDGYQFGIIANTSRPFCADCDRLRIGNDGKVYGCLSNSKGFDFDPSKMSLAATEEMLRASLALKQKKFFTGSEMSMKFIGG